MVEAGSNVFQNTTLRCIPGKLHRLIPVTSFQRDQRFDAAGPSRPTLKLEVGGGRFELSQEDRRKSARPVVEIPGIESKRGCALANRAREQSAVAKNIRHTEVRARTV